MAASRDSPDDDGYKRFTEDIHNVSYGSNSTSKLAVILSENKKIAKVGRFCDIVVLMYRRYKGDSRLILLYSWVLFLMNLNKTGEYYVLS